MLYLIVNPPPFFLSLPIAGLYNLSFPRPWDHSAEILLLWVSIKRLQNSESYWTAPIPTTGEAFVVLFDRWFRKQANRFAACQPCPSGADISALYVDPRLYKNRGKDASADKPTFRASPSRHDYRSRPEYKSGFKSPSAKRPLRPYSVSTWERLLKLCTQSSCCATWNGHVWECTRKKSVNGVGCTTPKGDLAHLCPRCKKDHKFTVHHHSG